MCRSIDGILTPAPEAIPFVDGAQPRYCKALPSVYEGGGTLPEKFFCVLDHAVVFCSQFCFRLRSEGSFDHAPLNQSYKGSGSKFKRGHPRNMISLYESRRKDDSRANKYSKNGPYAESARYHFSILITKLRPRGSRRICSRTADYSKKPIRYLGRSLLTFDYSETPSTNNEGEVHEIRGEDNVPYRFEPPLPSHHALAKPVQSCLFCMEFKGC